MSAPNNCVPSPVHKRTFSVVKEAHTSAADVIDLCSPVHTKPCRQQTPLMKDNGNSSTDTLVNDVGRSLFGSMNCGGVGDSPQYLEEEDPYWQPPGYSDTPVARNDKNELEREEYNTTTEDNELFAVAGSFISRHLHSHSRDEAESPGMDSIGDCAQLDVAEGSTNVLVQSSTLLVQTNAAVVDVIDLCSPVSVKSSMSAQPTTSIGIRLHGSKPGSSESFAAVEIHASKRHIVENKNVEITHASHTVRVAETIVDFTVDDDDGTAESSRESDRESGRGSYLYPIVGSGFHRSPSNLSVLSVESSTEQSFASSRKSSVVAVEHNYQHRQSTAYTSSAAHTTLPRSLFSVVTSGPTLREYVTHESQNSTHSHTITAQVAASINSGINTTSTAVKPAGSLHQILLAAQQQVEGKLLAEKQATAAASVKPASKTTETSSKEPPLQRAVSLSSGTKAPKKAATKATPKNAVVAPPAPTQPAVVTTSSAAPAATVAPVAPVALIRTTSLQISTAPVRAADSANPISLSSAGVSSSSHGPTGTSSSAAVRCIALPRKLIRSTSSSGVSAAASSSSAPSSNACAGNGRTDSAAAPKFRSRFTEKTLSPLPTLPADTHWEVMLLIDKRERSNAQIQSSMAARNIPCQLATLAVGDFLWVARIRTNNGAAAQVSTSIPGASSMTAPIVNAKAGNGTALQLLMPEEDTQMSATSELGDLGDEEIEDCDKFTTFVLDCVAERKSISDMASSMCDGRYDEQKNRLRACGLRSTMYIVEGEHIVLSMHQKAISAAHIKTAMVSIHVDSGMHVLRTRGMDHTISCLQNLHRQVERRFQQHCATSQYQTLAQFQSMYGKKGAATHRQLFGHQLRQIHGCSTSVAVTLMSRYGTTARFMDELKMLGQTKAEYTLTHMVNEITKRKLGAKLAQRLCQIYLAKF